MRTLSEKTIRIDIYMAGDLETAKGTCLGFCDIDDFCVHIEPVYFIYEGKEERGFKVGLIDYPPSPLSYDDLLKKAHLLGKILLFRCEQQSFSIVTPTTTHWVSIKDEE
jgi:hypothetical protein